MKNKVFLLSLSFLLASCAPGGEEGIEHHEEGTGAAMETNSTGKLNESPRHQEWVEVENNGKTIYTWVVYPETSEKRPVVILIHENRGLNDWARGMADQVAAAGYIGVAPDLLSGFSAERTRTSDFPDEDAARAALSEFKQEDVMADLKAVADWAKTIPASNGKLVSAGFCWGGSQSYKFATTSDDLAMTLVFYGTGPESEADYEKISSPVYGFHAGNDERVNATLEKSEEYMSRADKTYEYEMYDGAGHAFMRSGEDPNGDPANVAARNAAWERMKALLSEL